MKPELVCPAGTPTALRAAIEAGADAVYCGFRDETNARNFPGLNFSPKELEDSVRFAHPNKAKVLVAINTFARPGGADLWRSAIDRAAAAGADAVILADLGLLEYAARRHPDLRLHLSVQAAAATPEAIDFYVSAFSVKRVVLPRVLSVEEIATLQRAIGVETEAFVFGGLCPMAEGRCSLSSYATGRSPNLSGVCSPPEHVRYQDGPQGCSATLAGFTIDRFPIGEQPGYPTLCKGRFLIEDKAGYWFEDPVSLNASELVDQLIRAGVSALKIEGRQRGRAYVTKVVKAFRNLVDALSSGAGVRPTAEALSGLVEGGRQTTGAYRKQWK